MTFNEFNRRLEHCHLDEDTKYLFAHMFEVQTEMNRQLDIQASLIAAVVDSMQNVVNLHENTQAKVKAMMDFGKTPGVEVHSVRREPDDD